MDVVLLIVVVGSYQCSGISTPRGPSFTFNFTGQFNRLPYLDSIKNPSCTGTSIAVRYVQDAREIWDISYSIDGIRRLLPLQKNSSVPYLYNQSLFSVTGLRNTEHTLQVNTDFMVVRSVLLMPKVWEKINGQTGDRTTGLPNTGRAC